MPDQGMAWRVEASRRTAIVTGGASGIGRSLAEELCRRGAPVTVADVDGSLLEETVGELRSRRYLAEGARLDVTEFEAVKEVVEDAVRAHGRLDYTFNNAGIVIAGETQDFSHDDWQRVIDTNPYGVVHGVMAAYPLMVEQRSGHIVNTVSLAGLVPATGEISYTTSKYGVVGLSNALRAEAAHYGVKVGAVCPGFIRTPIYESCELIGLGREKATGLGPRGLAPAQVRPRHPARRGAQPGHHRRYRPGQGFLDHAAPDPRAGARGLQPEIDEAVARGEDRLTRPSPCARTGGAQRQASMPGRSKAPGGNGDVEGVPDPDLRKVKKPLGAKNRL